VAAITQQSESFAAPDRLISLEVHHESALEAFLGEFDSVPDELHGYFCHRDDSIEQIVTLLQAWSCDEQLAEGWVPNSTWFWEVDETLQGVINRSHWLTPSLEQDGGHIGYAVASSCRRPCLEPFLGTVEA
jgi:predicted acetyltransferase